MTHSDNLPLTGIRVLEMGRFVAAPFATQILADLGAEVIKIERPGGGDDIRGYGPPFLKRKDGSDETSFDFIAMNRNKKSVTIDFSSEVGAGLIRELAKASDVFVENFRAGHLARYGLGYDDIKAVAPDIVYCSISGFGQTGPYAHRPGLDSIFQAMSGLMSISGESDGPPTKMGVVISDMVGGLFSIVGILSALRFREVRGGGGQMLDMSLLETSIALLTARAQQYIAGGHVPRRTGADTPGNSPSGFYNGADGQFLLSAGSDQQFRTLARLLGDAGKADDERFATRNARVINDAALTEWMEAVFATRERAHWIRLLVENGIMCAPIHSVDEVFEDEHVKARGVVVEVEHPNAGTVPLLGNPIRFSQSRIPPFRAPPTIGQHTEEVLRGLLGKSEDDIRRLRECGAV